MNEPSDPTGACAAQMRRALHRLDERMRVEGFSAAARRREAVLALEQCIEAAVLDGILPAPVPSHNPPDTGGSGGSAGCAAVRLDDHRCDGAT